MKLIPNESKIPGFYVQENESDPTVYVKLFTPWAGWSWFLTEYDPEQDVAFGYAHNAADPQMAELGYVSITELRLIEYGVGPMGAHVLKIERDTHFAPQPLSSAKSALL